MPLSRLSRLWRNLRHRERVERDLGDELRATFALLVDEKIGVRMAIGASARDIVTLVFAQGMRPVGIGLGIGLIAALSVTPLLKSQLVQVSPADPLTLALTRCSSSRERSAA